MIDSIITTMQQEQKTSLELLIEAFNWTDTMQNIQEQPQGEIANPQSNTEEQVGPLELPEIEFSSQELYEIFPEMTKEALKTVFEEYKTHHQSDILNNIIQWKEDQENPTIHGAISIHKLTNEELLQICKDTDSYRRYCDRTTECIDDSWSEGSISGLLEQLNKTEKELEIIYYEIDRRCYLDMWFPNQE